MTEDEATRIVQEFLASTGTGGDPPLRWTDWDEIADRFPAGEEGERLAQAYAFLWRREGALDSGGEPMPSKYFVEAVEAMIGEPVWEGEAEA